jgi:hypothetical protein
MPCGYVCALFPLTGNLQTYGCTPTITTGMTDRHARTQFDEVHRLGRVWDLHGSSSGLLWYYRGCASQRTTPPRAHTVCAQSQSRAAPCCENTTDLQERFQAPIINAHDVVKYPGRGGTGVAPHPYASTGSRRTGTPADASRHRAPAGVAGNGYWPTPGRVKKHIFLLHVRRTIASRPDRVLMRITTWTNQ